METIGRYEVIRSVGQGAMGGVYLARDPSLERMVALKLLHDHVAGSARGRFHDEARALAALNHPGIVIIHEIGTHEERDFIAMEYLAGRSLREVLHSADLAARRGELLAICAKVAVAVAAAHHAGILHRDIKPENVVVTDAGDVKVVDFGLARRLTDGAEPRRPIRRFATPIEQIEDVVDALTATVAVPRSDADTIADSSRVITAGTQTVFGTPGYMAPEVLIGGESSEASDVYSLGVMIYECIAGRRPFDAPSLVEVMAMVIDGSVPAKPLDDPQWKLVERMLARAPAERPSLDEVAAALASVAPAPRGRRYPIAIAIAACAVGGVIVAWRLTRDVDHQPASGAAPAPDRHATIVVEPITNELTSYAPHPPTDVGMSDLLATLLGRARGIKLTSFGATDLVRQLGLHEPGYTKHLALSPAELARAETALGAELVLRGSIAVRNTSLHARFELARLDGTVVTRFELDRPVAERPKLMTDVAERAAKAIDSRAAVGHARDPELGRVLAAAGAAKLADVAFYDAEPYLEQAIDADASSFDAWYALASVRSWMQAPEQDVAEAIDAALRLAPEGLKQRLLAGVSSCLHERYRQGLERLEPLEAVAGLTNTEQRDLLYYLGEAHFHLGHEARGVDYFRRARERDPKFKPAMIHPMFYALARRDAATARELIALAGELDFSGVEFALGHYPEIAAHPGRYQIVARLVLDLPVAPELEKQLDTIDRSLLHIAQALEAGDEDASRRELDVLWTTIRAERGRLAPNIYYLLGQLGDILLCADRAADTRQLLEVLAAENKRTFVASYHRLAILAAPLLGERAPIDRADLTDREVQISDAIEAEMSGDLARAAALLKALIDEPTMSWNFPERVARLRVLRALHRTKEAEALCADTLRPALFHYAFLPTRARCRAAPRP